MKFDGAPALDYEYYSAVTLEPYYQMNYGDFKFPYGTNAFGLNFWARGLGLVIPDPKSLYTIASKLKGWQGHPVPVIYGNPSTLSVKCINSTLYNWSQFLLWIANWNVSAPVIPTAWKGQPYYIWQDKVIKGAAEWGVSGDMDHDIWGEKIPFPNVVPADTVSMKVYIHEMDKLIEVNDV